MSREDQGSCRMTYSIVCYGAEEFSRFTWLLSTFYETLWDYFQALDRYVQQTHYIYLDYRS
jgi:hypothetical protein